LWGTGHEEEEELLRKRRRGGCGGQKGRGERRQERWGRSSAYLGAFYFCLFLLFSFLPLCVHVPSEL
jgi:hypothetical protein